MKKKDYIVRQLARTKSKKFEQYVVTRIIHLLDDISVKFVTQQYVSRPGGRAFTDLFFPQLDLHIEVKEEFHKKIAKKDKLREADIINATSHTIEEVDASLSIEGINDRVKEILGIIKKLLKSKKKDGFFKPWDIDAEFNPATYIDAGRIDVVDNVAFKTGFEACNCFGNNYKGLQTGGGKHPDPNTIIWLPKLFGNGEWDNSISTDEKTIIEKNVDPGKRSEHVNKHLASLNDKRVVFAKIKDNLGQVLYRFKGLYELDISESKIQNALVWKRVSTHVDTYPRPEV